MKIVECVPNFSEGRNRAIINKISDSIGSTAGVSLLDISTGYAANRTVYTFVGEPEAVLAAAYGAIKMGTELIDMSAHRGAHPRIGACDVCPFVPVSDTNMEVCVELARALGEQVGRELNIPVFLYEYAASTPRRKNLADIRSGEYEALEKKLAKTEWKPDFGPFEYNERVKKSGATVIGARKFLIAYNINLNSRDRMLAHKIAVEIRESGKSFRDENGKEARIPGKLKHCKAIGWYVDDYKRAQVSINLTDYHITNMHHAFEAAIEEASILGLKVTGSEIVGLIPKRALIETGLYYIKKEGSKTFSEKELIDIAVHSLGLNDVTNFNADEKIIEYRIHNKACLQP